ncbi:MAG: tetratricopeptide repeat protein [Candidatus Zixiibacteriota bacterium]|nr:MAG: tetratricopeptide repeat protein [candidate division Zixibacteria bacterium]
MCCRLRSSVLARKSSSRSANRAARRMEPMRQTDLRQAMAVWAIALMMLLSAPVARGDYRALNEKGNKALTEDKTDEALKYYKDAEVEKPKQPVLDYNIGSALYKQNKYPEAVQRYIRALNTDDPKFQADTYYNSGNALFRAEQYAEAINAYKKCLEINADDSDAKYNLELARVKLKEQAQKQDKQQQDQQQKDQQQNPQDQQDQQKQQEQQQNGQQQQDQQKSDQEQQQQQDEQQNGDQNQEQQQQQQKASREQPQKMSKQDAERILNAINSDEKNLQKELTRFKVGTSNPGRGGKDW